MEFIDFKEELYKNLRDPEYLSHYLQGAFEDSPEEFRYAVLETWRAWQPTAPDTEKEMPQNINERLYADLRDPEYCLNYIHLALEEDGTEGLRLAIRDAYFALYGAEGEREKEAEVRQSP